MISSAPAQVCEGVLATGTVHAALVGECARCLTEIAGERDFEFQELFCYPGRDTDEDALHIVDDHIDIEQPMRDAIVLELPFTLISAVLRPSSDTA